MIRPRCLALLPYLGAVAFVVAATLTRFAADPVLKNRQPFAFFIVGIILAARYCGFAPSLLAILLSGLSSVYFFIPPRDSLIIDGQVERGSFGFFILIGLFVAFMMRSEQRAKQEARQKARVAIEKQQELEREVAERKRTEAIAREAEERFRLLANDAPIGIAQADAQGAIFFVNGKWCELAGVTPQEALEFSWKQFIHPDDQEAFVNHWQSHLQAGQDMPPHECRILHTNGDIRWVSSSISMLKDVTGGVTGQIVAAQDITERKAVADALRESEGRFRAFMDNNPAIAWAKDEQGRYVYLSKSYERQLKIRLEEARGKTDFDLWPKDLAQGYWESDQRVLASALPVQVTDIMKSGNERKYWLKAKFLFEDSQHGRLVGGVGVDVSELKQTEESLRTKQELLRYLIEVQEHEKQFLCHEFHDGLIQYAAGSLMSLEGYRSNRPPTDDLSQIDAAIVNLRKGVEDGRRVIRGIRPAVLDDSGLEAAIDDLIGQFKNSGIMVTQKCDPQIGRLPDMIQTTVYRVVQEALNNARKHSGTDVVRIELNKANGDLHLEVQDFGCGFDMQATDKRGFGLPGMAERCRILGGECRIQSEQDVGTRISVRLPIPSAS